MSEIHAYPLRPEGFEEPLFHTPESRRRILEHLAASEWLCRASEAPRPASRPPEKMPPDEASHHKGRVLASWREVDRWWTEDGVDRVCYLLRRAGGREEVHARSLWAA